MKVQTLLTEQVGWNKDVTVEEVYFEVVDEHGLNEVEVYSIDEIIDPDKLFTYFYALNEDGFYWGNVQWGEYIHYGYYEGLIHLVEYEELSTDFMLKNPRKIGEIITDSIIADKDAFETFWLLKSYAQIYNDFPLINQLREYLTDFYELYVPANVQPEEVECAS